MASSIKVPKPQYSAVTRKKVGVSIAFFAIAILLIFTLSQVSKASNQLVTIASYKTDVTATTQITQNDLAPFEISAKEYNAHAHTLYTTADGKTESGQIYVLWTNIKAVIGKYPSDLQTAGTQVMLNHVTSTDSSSNPWLAELKDGQEVYTMAFNTSDLDTRMLVPGSHVRIRMLINVDASQYQTLQKLVTDREDKILGAADENAAADNLAPILSAGTATGASGTSGGITQATNNTSEQLSEIVCPDLTVADIQNANGGSFFDIYNTLASMSATSREKYLMSQVKSGTQFMSQLSGTKVVLIISRTEASFLSQLGDSNLKFTILVEGKNGNNLYSKFQDINAQINSILALTTVRGK